MLQHTTISGHVIEYPEPEPKLEALLRQLRRMVDDPSMIENDMIEIAYSKDNPLLGSDLFPTRGAVTRETLANPAYYVMTDLLGRKRIAQDGIDVAKLASEYTLTVPEAAERLGIHESAVRLAIRSRRIPSWVKDGQYFLAPRSVDSFAVGTRGPQPQSRVRAEPLDVCIGNTEGQSLRMRYPGELRETGHTGHIVEGQIGRWRRVGVISGGDGKHRFFELEPADSENELKFGPFYVRGRFSIVKKVNAAKKAREAWQTFTAA